MKNFTKQNFKTNPLWVRLIIMTFMLLAGSSSAWAYCTSYNGTYNIYFDARTLEFNHAKTINLMFEKSDGSGGVTMSPVAGTKNLYLWKSSDWGNCSVDKIAFFETDAAWGWEYNSKLINRKNYANKASVIHTLNANFQSNILFSENITRTNSYSLPNYKVTVENYVGTTQTADAGTITVKKWNSTSSSAGSSYSTAFLSSAAKTTNSTTGYLTALEVTVAPKTGYKLKSLTVGGTSVNSGYQFELTAATTIKATWEKSCEDPDENDFNFNLSSVEYNGQAKPVDVSWKSGTGSGTITVYYKSGNGSYDTQAPTNVGTYTVAIKATEGGDYCETQDYVVLGTFEITCKDPSITMTGTEVTYNGSAQKPNVTIDGGATPTLKYSDNTFANGPTNAGTYAVTVSAIKTGNYCALTDVNTGNFIINKKQPAKADFTYTATADYSGSGIDANVSLKSPYTGAGKIYTYYKTSTTEYTETLPVDAGVYTVAISLEEGTNFNASNGKIELGTFTITCPKPEQPQLKVNENDKIEICEGKENAYGYITIENYAKYTNCKFYLGNINQRIYPDNGLVGVNIVDTYKIIVENACGETAENSIEITADILTPTLTEISISSNVPTVCAGDNNVTLTCNLVNPVGTPSYKWFKNGVEIVGETSNSIPAGTLNKNTTFSVSVILDNGGCTKEFTASKEIEVKQRPDAPTFDSNEMSVCAGQQFNLPIPNNLPAGDDVTGLWTVEGQPTTQSQTLQEARVYKYTAYINNGCPSDGTDFTVTVNPLPTISIEQTEPATVYKYADVKLKASGDNISTVVWTADKGTITRQPNYPDDSKRAMLTYDQAGTVNVTATATSEFGCPASSEFQVVFTEEDCSDVTTTYNNKTKIKCKKPSEWNKLYIYSWDVTDANSNTWPGKELTEKEGEYYIYVFENVTKNFKIIFNNNGNNSNQTVDGEGLQAGKIYTPTIGNKNGDNKRTLTLGTPADYKDTTPATKSNPTIKTVSVISNEDGEVTLNGMVVATGCNDQAKLGLQYKKQNQDGTWPDAYSTVEPNTKEDISKGKTYTTTVTLEDGTYKVRACAHADGDRKGYGYDVIITVSAFKYPIKNITLDYSNEAGNIIPDPNPMCKGTTAYIRLDCEGSTYSEYQWYINGVATQEIKGENNVWFFDIKEEKESVSVRLRNDANVDNEENPTWVESGVLVFTMVPEPISPTISLSPNVICSNNVDGATLNMAALVAGQSYELYKYADENDNTGAKVAGYNAIQCTDVSQNLSFTGLKEAGRYFVKAHNTTQCQSIMAGSAFSTLEVVDASDVFINFVPTSATTTPWMPAKFTVNASDKYTLTVPEGVVYNIDGNKVSVKIPLPEGSTGGDGQYENVTFPQGAKTSYTITANLATTGGSDNPCASPASATITLVPYEEPCVTEHNN